MADWHEPFEAAYRFMRVSRLTGYETEQLDGIISGTLQLNQDTETFETADLVAARRLDLGADLVRGYLDATFGDGTVETVCLGTWLCNVPSRRIDGVLEDSTAVLDGRLQELAEDSFDAPVTVAAGENAVSYAVGIAQGAGLACSATPSDSTLTTDWTFGLQASGEEDGGSKLEAVNALLALAGYGSASTDRMGSVVMAPYVDPAQRTPVWTFEEGVNATFLAEADEERDTSAVANVVLAIYEDSESTVIGEAVDDDPMSPYSTVSIGRRKVVKKTYHGTATQAEADAKAAELLKTNQSVIHRVKLQHVHCPATVGDVVRLKWPSAGIDATFAIRTQTVKLGSAGCMTVSELRRFVRR